VYLTFLALKKSSLTFFGDKIVINQQKTNLLPAAVTKFLVVVVQRFFLVA